MRNEYDLEKIEQEKTNKKCKEISDGYFEDMPEQQNEYKLKEDRQDIVKKVMTKAQEQIDSRKRDKKIEAIYEKIANWYECDIEGCAEGNRHYDKCFIGDCLDWIECNHSYLDRHEIFIYALWKKKRLPVEEQSDECIDYIFRLLNSDKNYDYIMVDGERIYKSTKNLNIEELLDNI